MSKLGIFFLLIGVLVAFLSCSSPSFDSPEEMYLYLADQENGFLQENTVKGIHFQLMYKPTDLLVEQEVMGDDTPAQIDSLRKKYGEYLYFNLSISRNEQEILNSLAGDRGRFGEMVNTLAFGMQERIHMITSRKDTIPILDYIYPRMYGMSGATTLLLVYPRTEDFKETTSFKITLEDMGLATGEVHFKFKTANILDQPGLNIL